METVALSVGVALLVVVFARNRLARLEGQFRTARELALRRPSYRPPTGDEAALLAQLAVESNAVRALGLRDLGDTVEVHEDVSAQPARWFVDDAGTTFAILVRLPYSQRASLHLFSLAPDHAILTARSAFVGRPMQSLARPPYVDFAQTTESFAIALELHRKRAARAAAPFATIATLADAQRELADHRDAVAAWRDAQPPAELLDRDLRLVFHEHYGLWGPLLRRRVMKPAEARARA